MGGTKSSLPVAATRRSWFESGEEAAVAAQVLQAYRSLVADSSLCGIEDRGPGRELLYVSKIATQARDAVRCPGTTSIATPVCLARGEWVTRMLHSVPRRYLGACQHEVWTGELLARLRRTNKETLRRLCAGPVPACRASAVAEITQRYSCRRVGSRMAMKQMGRWGEGCV